MDRRNDSNSLNDQLLTLREAVVDFIPIFIKDILEHPVTWMIWSSGYVWIWIAPSKYVLFWIVIFGIGLLVSKVEDNAQ